MRIVELAAHLNFEVILKKMYVGKSADETVEKALKENTARIREISLANGGLYGVSSGAL